MYTHVLQSFLKPVLCLEVVMAPNGLRHREHHETQGVVSGSAVFVFLRRVAVG